MASLVERHGVGALAAGARLALSRHTFASPDPFAVPDTAAVHPQKPRMLTIVVAIVLTLIGLAVVFYDSQSVNFVQGLNLPNDIQRQLVGWMQDKTIAWGALLLSPLLLIAGSLVRWI